MLRSLSNSIMSIKCKPEFKVKCMLKGFAEPEMYTDPLPLGSLENGFEFNSGISCWHDRAGSTLCPEACLM